MVQRPVARVSRGRTIRTFIAGVLALPCLFVFAWLAVFGDTALELELFDDAGIAALVTAGRPVAVILVFACANLARALRREYRVAGVGPASTRPGAVDGRSPDAPGQQSADGREDP